MTTWTPTSVEHALDELRAAIARRDTEEIVRATYAATCAGADSESLRASLRSDPATDRSATLVAMDDVADALEASIFRGADGRTTPVNCLAHQEQSRLGLTADTPLLDVVGQVLGVGSARLDLKELFRLAAGVKHTRGRIDGRLVWLVKDDDGMTAMIEGSLARSSAPPPDEVSAMRHELANALTAVSAMAASVESASEPELRRTLTRIRELSRAASEHPSSKPSRLKGGRVREISSELRELIESLAPFAAERAVHVDARIDPGIRSTLPHATLRLVVWNVLKNAIEACPAGVPVIVDIRVRAHRLRLRFTDRGTGIPDELRERIFEPHFSTKSNGRGIGLSLVRAEVERLGGMLSLDSRAEGTTFVISLPGADVDESAPDVDSGVITARPLADVEVALVTELKMLDRALTAFGAKVDRLEVGELRALLAAGGEPIPQLLVDGALMTAEEAAVVRRRGVARRVVYIARTNESPGAVGLDVVLPRGFEVTDLAQALLAGLGDREAADGDDFG